MSDLKPCPFCGGEAELLDYRTIFRVECKTCLAGVNGDRATEPESDEHCESIDWNLYEKTALDRWNNRPHENRIKAEAVQEFLNNEAPILSDEGLDVEIHHCEFVLQQERKRLHQAANKLERAEH